VTADDALNVLQKCGLRPVLGFPNGINFDPVGLETHNWAGGALRNSALRITAPATPVDWLKQEEALGLKTRNRKTIQTAKYFFAEVVK
jgi:hypothetical protein